MQDLQVSFEKAVFVKTLPFYHLLAKLLNLRLHGVFSWIAGLYICNVTHKLGAGSKQANVSLALKRGAVTPQLGCSSVPFQG